MTDTAWFVFVATGGALGSMILQGSDPAGLSFNWKPDRLAFSLLGGCIAAIVVGAIRLLMWRRGHPEALD